LRAGVSKIEDPKFKIQGVELGAVDLKINHLGNRIAVSSMDSSMRIFNVHPDSGLTLYKEIESEGSSSIWKIDFNPNGNEILTGTTSLKTYDISTG
jgi:WD40 repeat protein